MNDSMRKITGFLRLQKHLAKYQSQQAVKEIVDSYFNGKRYSEDKTYVMMVGLSKSGKTYIVENNSILREYFKISTNLIHNTINARFPFLKDDNTVGGKGYWERQYLTGIIRERVLMRAFSLGIPIVSDSCNLSRKDRKKRLAQAKAFDYVTVIIRVRCPSVIHLKRLKDADEENIAKGEKPTWVDLYVNQKDRFHEPNAMECDDLIYTVSPTPNPEGVY